MTAQRRPQPAQQSTGVDGSYAQSEFVRLEEHDKGLSKSIFPLLMALMGRWSPLHLSRTACHYHSGRKD